MLVFYLGLNKVGRAAFPNTTTHNLDRAWLRGRGKDSGLKIEDQFEFPIAYTTRMKLRGVERRLHALGRWVNSLVGFYPESDEFTQSDAHWNLKLPVDHALVESRHTTQETRQRIAQALINAAVCISANRKLGFDTDIVVATICLPDLWSSEICVYRDPEYFESHTKESTRESAFISRITDRSLAQKWTLTHPSYVEEIGLKISYAETDTHQGLASENWYFVCKDA